jgi:hypothetical protein
MKGCDVVAVVSKTSFGRKPDVFSSRGQSMHDVSLYCKAQALEANVT